MLRDIESKLAGLVEGTFGRLFRSEVTPAELARGLAREMEATRRQGLDRTWAAHHYDVYLSPDDHDRILRLGPSLLEELSNHLLVHAREQRYALAHTPVVRLHRGDELPPSRYGVAAIHEDPDDEPPAPSPARSAEPPADHAAPIPAPRQPTGPVAEPRRARSGRVPTPPGGAAGAARPRAGAPPRSLVVVLEGRREPIGPDGGVIGRSRECDVVIASAEVSRRHCEIWPGRDGWTIDDLGSTNGVVVDGVPVQPGRPAPLRPGAQLELGTIVARVEAGA